MQGGGGGGREDADNSNISYHEDVLVNAPCINCSWFLNYKIGETFLIHGGLTFNN